MIRATFALLVMIIGAGAIGIEFPRTESGNGSGMDIDSLKEQRVKLLQDRVATIKNWIDQGRAATSEVIRPEMDVINAQLDYVESNIERKKLLGQLLKKYDMLIELAEFQVGGYGQPGSHTPNHQMLAESELLHLKSERIRIQIQRDTLD